MAYTPTTWTDGDLITAEKLNKLEAGVQNEQVGPQGPKGPAGPQGPAGQGIPTGGTTGQVLVKNSDTDYDTSWADQTGGGGTTYTPGDGIAILGQTISAKLSGQANNAASFASDGGIFVSGSPQYSAEDGIQINGSTIQANISSASDNATGILNGAIYTPATFQTTVMPMISVSTVPATPDVQVTATKGELSVSGTTGADGKVELEVTAFGVWTVSGTVDDQDVSVDVPVSKIQEYSINLAKTYSIYGAVWDGSASPAWSRTDGAELFADPEPAVNNGTGSSPFDDIMPWSGMQKVEDPVGGTMVSIPKYWYKWTRSGASMQLQISNVAQEGFFVSPAHADRGDGQGERDVVYVGRYHCGSDYKSTTGVLPIVQINIDTSRTKVSALGDEYWQYDFAMYWTIRMLYLVEFANWNSQSVIGYGCSPDGTLFNVGLTDAMTYHTGTSAVTRETYGCCQYRNIEGMWDNSFDFSDGIYFSGTEIYCIINPNNFGSNSGGVNIGELPGSQGVISEWSNPQGENVKYALFPTQTNGSEVTFVCDSYISQGDSQVLMVGSSYPQAQERGMFAFSVQSNTTFLATGCRAMKLPNA